MGIPIRGGRRKRRSYADYRPSKRRQGPRSDPFRVVLYLIGIGVALWMTLNPEIVRGFLIEEAHETGVSMALGPQPTATTNPSDTVTMAEEAYQAGKLDEAIEYYRQAGAAAPNTVDYPFQEARLLVYRSALEYGEQREATLEDALDAADRAILANAEDARGYAIMGKIRDWQGQPEAGLNELSRALELDDTLAIAHSYLAEIQIDLDRWDQAQTSIDRAMQLDPGSVDVRRDYGYILESLGDYTAAALQYETALQLQPNLPALRMSLARVYRVNGLYEEALDQFFEVESLFPQHALIPYEIGRTYETYIGDPTAALEAYQHAIELDADFPSPWVRLGTLSYLQGDYLQATTAFEMAIELGVEDNVDVLYQLGLAYANQGECDEAIPVLQQARTLAGEDERILDLVNSGFETCSQPTPTPGGTEEP